MCVAASGGVLPWCCSPVYGRWRAGLGRKERLAHTACCHLPRCQVGHVPLCKVLWGAEAEVQYLGTAGCSCNPARKFFSFVFLSRTQCACEAAQSDKQEAHAFEKCEYSMLTMF